MDVLLVDDDLDLADVTAYALRREGFSVTIVTNGQEALQRAQRVAPDVIVLDVVLPGMSGLDVCSAIRERDATPIILLTARHDEEQIMEGFRRGADDYVTKPFSPRQLAMRIRAVARRGARTWEPEPQRELRLEDLLLDVEAQEVRQGEATIALTGIEFRLLQLLVSNAGRVVRSERLVDFAWNYEGGDRSLLKTHLSHLRTKLGWRADGKWDIAAVQGVGYRLLQRSPEHR